MRRVAIPLDRLPYWEQDLVYLKKQGFEVVSNEVLLPERLITPLLGVKYKRGALDEEAPGYFDCTSLSPLFVASYNLIPSQ